MRIKSYPLLPAIGGHLWIRLDELMNQFPSISGSVWNVITHGLVHGHPRKIARPLSTVNGLNEPGHAAWFIQSFCRRRLLKPAVHKLRSYPLYNLPFGPRFFKVDIYDIQKLSLSKVHSFVSSNQIF
jgi:hypothetical protein